MITICISNHKGGVGKTTTAVNLATGLAALDYPVVLIDCDPQGNVASFLGQEPAPGLYDLLVARARPGDVCRRIGDSKLAIVPGDASTVDVETLLRTSPRLTPATALRSALAQFKSSRETIIILDTAPSLSSVQVAALSAADWLIIPASPEYASETGISALVQAVADLQNEGLNLNLLGILPTMVDSRSREHKETITDLHSAFPGYVLPPVRRLIAIAEAPRQGQNIWDYAPNAAQEYADVLNQVLQRIGLKSKPKTRGGNHESAPQRVK